MPPGAPARPLRPIQRLLRGRSTYRRNQPYHLEGRGAWIRFDHSARGLRSHGRRDPVGTPLVRARESRRLRPPERTSNHPREDRPRKVRLGSSCVLVGASAGRHRTVRHQWQGRSLGAAGTNVSAARRSPGAPGTRHPRRTQSVEAPAPGLRNRPGGVPRRSASDPLSGFRLRDDDPTTLSALDVRTGRTTFNAAVGVGEIALNTHRIGVLSPGRRRLSVLTRKGQLEWTRIVDPRTSGIARDDRRVYLTVNGRPPSLLFCPSS